MKFARVKLCLPYVFSTWDKEEEAQSSSLSSFRLPVKFPSPSRTNAPPRRRFRLLLLGQVPLAIFFSRSVDSGVPSRLSLFSGAHLGAHA